MNGVVLISMEMFLAMVFFHFHKVAYGAIVEEYGMLNWLKLRYGWELCMAPLVI